MWGNGGEQASQSSAGRQLILQITLQILCQLHTPVAHTKSTIHPRSVKKTQSQRTPNSPKMSYPNLTIDCHDSNIYVITMRKLPENRLNVTFSQEIIRALRDIETRLGKDAEGPVIIRGSDTKFFCTVNPPQQALQYPLPSNNHPPTSNSSIKNSPQTHTKTSTTNTTTTTTTRAST